MAVFYKSRLERHIWRSKFWERGSVALQLRAAMAAPEPLAGLPIVPWLGVLEVIALRTCSRATCMHHCMEKLPAQTAAQEFLHALFYEFRAALACPIPVEDWSPEQPVCSSPVCRRRTGLWVPTRADNLDPCVDSVFGSESVALFLRRHANVGEGVRPLCRSVACSPSCQRMLRKMYRLRRDSSSEVVIAVHHRVTPLVASSHAT